MVLQSYITCPLGNGASVRHDLATDNVHVQLRSSGPWVNVGRPHLQAMNLITEVDLDRIYQVALEEAVRKQVRASTLEPVFLP